MEYFGIGMMVLVLPLIVFPSAGLLGFAFLYKSVPIAFLNVCLLILIGYFLQPWSIFSTPPMTENLFSWKVVVIAWITFLVIGIAVLVALAILKKKRHRHRRFTF